jgi:hypothetical protein
MIQEAHVAYETTDDRGSRGKLIGIFSTKELAVSAADKQGWYGGPGDVSKQSVLWLDDDTCLLLANPTIYPVNANLPKIAAQNKREAAQRLVQTMKREDAVLLGIDYDAVLKASQ